MKRIFKAASIVVAILVMTALGIWWYIGRSGSSALEAWIGGQIIGVLESYINPQVAFRDLDYQAPRTVVVEDMSFTTADDRIMHIDRVLLELAEIPRRGKPIKIQRVELTRPHVQFLTTSAGRLAGWGDFVRQQAVKDPKSVPEGRRFSDILVLRHVAIRDGEVIYNDGRNEPMILPGIELAFDTPPVEGKPGEYRLVGTFQRRPLFEVELDGTLNLDTALLDIASLRFDGELDESGYGTLPPAVQAFLRRHRVLGRLVASWKGRIPLGDLDGVAGEAKVRLTNAQVGAGGEALAVGSIDYALTLPDQKSSLTIRDSSLRGRVPGGGEREVLSIAGIQVDAEGLPGGDAPMIVRLLRIVDPTVTLIPLARGGLMGFSALVERIDNDDPPATQPTAPKAAATRPAAFTDYVILRRLEVVNAGLAYVAGGAGEGAAVKGMNITLDTEPVEDGSDRYRVAGRITREPLLDGEIRGTLDPRGAVLDLEKLVLAAKLGDAEYEALPARARELLKRHRVRGEIAVEASGRIPLGEVEQADARLHVTMQNVSFGMGDLVVPAKKIEATARWPDGVVDVAIDALGMRQGETEILQLPHAAVKLSGLRGAAPAVESAMLNRPVVWLRGRAGGGLIGWSALDGGAAPSERVPHGAGDVGVLGAVAIRELRINRGAVHYQPAGAPQATVVEGLNMEASAMPVSGGYEVSVSGSAGDALTLQVEGRLADDGGELALKRCDLTAQLSPATWKLLPPQVRPMVEGHQVSGRVTGGFAGSVNLNAPAASTGRATLEARDASFTINEATIPIGRATVTATLPDGPVAVAVEALALRHGEFEPLRVARAEATLPRIPASGKDVMFSAIRLEQPSVRLVRTAEGGWQGWSALIAGGAADTRPAEAGASRAAELPVRKLVIDRGEVVYDAGEGDGPVTLSGIAADVDVDPAAEPPWIRLAGQVRCAPLLDVAFDGRFRPDTAVAEIQRFTAKANFDASVGGALPAELQAALRKHQLTGSVNASARGTFPLRDLGATRGEVHVDAAGTAVGFGDLSFPMGAFKLDATLPEGPIVLQGMDLAIRHHDQSLLSLKSIDLKLPSLPRAGQPIIIDRLAADTPALLLVKDPAGGWVGWNDLLGSGGQGQSEPAGAASGGMDGGVLIHELNLRAGQVTYDPGGGGNVMSLGGINVEVKMPPIAGQPGWYALSGSVSREPLISVKLDSRVNLSESMLDVKELSVNAALGEDQYGTLPPQVQQVLRAHEVRGTLRTQLTGRIPWKRPAAVNGRLQVELSDGRFVTGESVWPVDRLLIDASAAGGKASAKYDVRLLGGSIVGAIEAGLDGRLPLQGTWQADGIRLEQTLRAAQGRRPRYAGRMSSTGSVGMQLDNLPASLAGQGALEIVEGRLLELPVLKELADIAVIASLGTAPRGQDSAQAAFLIQPEALDFSRMEVVSSLVALRGKGKVFYAGPLDLEVNVEVLKEVRGALGEIGRIIGAVSGRMVTYKVTGTTSAPRVGVKAPRLGR